MANQTVTAELITIHARGSLTLYWRPRNEQKERIDASDRIVFFEADGVPIREPFSKDPNDPLGLRVRLGRSHIELLKKAPTRCAFVDETNIAEDAPVVVFECKIAKYGYTGAPDAVDDQ